MQSSAREDVSIKQSQRFAVLVVNLEKCMDRKRSEIILYKNMCYLD